MNYEAQTYIVTGGGGGIGGAVVTHLRKNGANVVAVDLSSRRLEAIVQSTRGLGGAIEPIKADVTSEDATREIVARCLAVFGELHGLANVAGGMVGITEDAMDLPLSRISLEYFRKTFALNVESAFLMCKAAEPHFASRGYGKIVNVASLAAFANRPELGNAAYNPAKAAVVALTQTLSLLLGPQGIRVNAIAPGLVISERVSMTFGEGYVSRHLALAPLGKLATVEDVAAAIAFLLEPASNQITGEVLRVSAGVR